MSGGRVTWPAIVFWVLILVGTVSRGPLLLYLFGVSSAFATLQMLPGDIVGGANVLPQAICAAALVAKILLDRSNLTRGLSLLLNVWKLGLLTAFLIFAFTTTFVLPRLFYNQVEVVSLGASLSGASLLQPSFNNVTQLGYVTLSVGVAAAFSVAGTNWRFRRHYLIAMLLGGLTLIVTGTVDVATYSLGIGQILDPFRNVTYTLLTDVEALGSKRVVGLTPEASAFGSLCLSSLAILAFLRPCFGPRLRNTVVPLTMGGLFIMAALSTSSGAYVALVVFAALFTANWIIRLRTVDALARADLRSELVVIVLAAFSLLCVVVLFPQMLSPVYDMVDAIVLKKSASSSYIERNMWTDTAWRAFEGTSGLGVGLGGARTSNWFVSILSNTGVVGGILMFGFILRSFAVKPRAATPRVREWCRALKFTLLPSLVIGWFSGTTPDIGVAAASIYGLLISLDGWQPRPEVNLVLPKRSQELHFGGILRSDLLR